MQWERKGQPESEDKLFINLNITDYFYKYFEEAFKHSATKRRENVAFELEQ